VNKLPDYYEVLRTEYIDLMLKFHEFETDRKSLYAATLIDIKIAQVRLERFIRERQGT
jgi:hypothetical protein